jgi:DNA-binding response OmpR family regulator
MRLLVYDDDAAIGRLVVRVATSVGMEAVAVTEATSFEESIRTNPPQVIVLDLQLGNTDGITQLRMLASQAYTGALVLMSGFDPRVLATAHTLADKSLYAAAIHRAVTLARADSTRDCQ